MFKEVETLSLSLADTREYQPSYTTDVILVTKFISFVCASLT